MNFLAHFLLSCPREEIVVGNFLADFLRKAEQDRLQAPYQPGIILHYAIDKFTDQHPRVQHSVHLLRDRHSKYAPVILDVLFDYVLAQNWSTFSTESLPVFTQRMYRILERHLEIMPTHMQQRVPNMIHHNWLLSYTTLNGLEYTFDLMKKRVSKPAFFTAIIASLEQSYLVLEEDFLSFFPDMQAYARKVCTTQLS